MGFSVVFSVILYKKPTMLFLRHSFFWSFNHSNNTALASLVSWTRSPVMILAAPLLDPGEVICCFPIHPVREVHLVRMTGRQTDNCLYIRIGIIEISPSQFSEIYFLLISQSMDGWMDMSVTNFVKLRMNIDPQAWTKSYS